MTSSDTDTKFHTACQPIGRDAWLVRIGCRGDLYQAELADSAGSGDLSRGRRVLVRTSRGVELGEIVRAVRHSQDHRPPLQILRSTTDQDELLIGRLQVHRAEAVAACREAIRSRGLDAVLLDVDHLFDGGTLLLHFLGQTDGRLDRLTEQIVKQYEAVVRTQEFSGLLESGCGPGCGTEDGPGCGSQCGSCLARGACGSRD